MDSPWYYQRGTILPSSGDGASERLYPSEGVPRTGRHEDAGVQVGNLPSGKRAPLAAGIEIPEPE